MSKAKNWFFEKMISISKIIVKSTVGLNMKNERKNKLPVLWIISHQIEQRQQKDEKFFRQYIINMTT